MRFKRFTKFGVLKGVGRELLDRFFGRVGSGGNGKKLDLPPATGVRYDLLRGGIAAPQIETSAENPVLLLDRTTRIAKLDINSALRIRLMDERGAPVDGHAAAVRPVGRIEHQTADQVLGGAAESQP